jgi:hypothetical protein
MAEVCQGQRPLGEERRELGTEPRQVARNELRNRDRPCAPLLRAANAPRVVSLSSIAGRMHFDDLQFEKSYAPCTPTASPPGIPG